MASDLTQIMTSKADGSDQRLLSQEGSVTGLSYSFSTPGGCNQMQCTLAVSAGWRGNALNPGRLVQAWRGGAVAWAGILDEPVPGQDGWQVTAHGAGAFGDDYLALWTGSWGTGVFDNAVNAAIGRGLPWVNPGIGAPSGIWTGQTVDSGAQTITDLLNLGCHKGGLTWMVRTGPGDANTLSVFALPTASNRYLITGDPAGRSIGDGPTTLYVRYQATWDTGKTAATFATTSVTNSAQEAAFGRREDIMDISSAGVYTAGNAQAVASQALKRYQRVAFADPFTVQPGDLLALGGEPVDLGLFFADGFTAMVCELWLADYPYGGEVAGGPVVFLVGEYVFNADGTATITPFNSERHDWSSVMGAAVDATPVRVKPHKKHKRKHKK